MTTQSLTYTGPLDLDATLHSGQAFRWRRHERWHIGWIGNRPIRLRTHNHRLEYESPTGHTPDELRHYLRLDATHHALADNLPELPQVRAAVDRFPGLRVLRQDPWETTAAFVVSQNSNQARIAQNLDDLARAYGTRHPGHGFAFPGPHRLAEATEADLRALGLGYRAPYLLATSRRVADGDPDVAALRSLEYAQALAALTDLPGIGPKVADCILLYGADHLDAVPMDVWVRRIMVESLGASDHNQPYRHLRRLASQTLGPMAGYIQHYLFHYRRTVGPLPRPNP